MTPAHARDVLGGRRRRGATLTVLAVLTLITASLAVGGFARPAFAQPTATGAATGAAIQGMTEYEAESATTNGTVIGPDYTQGDLATEASGREAVQLTAQGQYVQFTLTAQANAFDVSY